MGPDVLLVCVGDPKSKKQTQNELKNGMHFGHPLKWQTKMHWSNLNRDARVLIISAFGLNRSVGKRGGLGEKPGK